MTKKGITQEIFSKTTHVDDPSSGLSEEVKNLETIPGSRIQLIKKDQKLLFRKYQVR